MIAPDLETGIRHLRELMEHAKVVVPFTGAGLSTECGIPDFRSPGGIWTKMKPIEFGDFLASREMRDESWRRRLAMEEQFGGAKPGRGHRALASLYKAGKVPGVITQNIDNLHQDSGIAAEHVVELHGNTTYASCLDCAKHYELAWVKERFAASGGRSPDCPGCGGFIKTATVSFGQSMPEAAMRRAQELTEACDLFLAIGSSLVVWPAAGFPLAAKRNGARSSSSTGMRPSSTKSPIWCCTMTSVRRSRRSSRIDLPSKSYSQAKQTPIAKTHLFLFHEGANVIFDEEIRDRVHQETKFRGNRVVMASENFPKGLGLGPQEVSDVSDETATVVELSGVIKWFDVSKGYGFIVPDGGGADILLHVTCLRRDGFQTAYEGARVVAEVLQRPKGYQCFRVLSMDESTAVHPSTLPPARTHVSVTPTSGLERAMVKWFNRLRGFGFLTRGEGTPDIFVHMETLRRFGLAELRPGQTVLVRFGPGPKGLMAAEVRPDGGAYTGPASH